MNSRTIYTCVFDREARDGTTYDGRFHCSPHEKVTTTDNTIGVSVATF